MIFDTLLNYGLSYANADYNNQVARERERENRNETYRLNEQAAQNADARTRSLFNDFYSMPAQMGQLREAGLSPSIFGSGISGMTGTQGAQGAGAPETGVNVFGAQTPQMHMDAAAILESQSRARLNNAEADRLEGKNPMGEAQVQEIYSTIQNLLADTNYKQAETHLTIAETYGKELDNMLTGVTAPATIKKAYSVAEKEYNYAKEALFSAAKAKIDWTIADATVQDKIKQIQTDTAQKVANVFKTYKEIELTEAQIKMIEDEIAQKWEELRIQSSNAGTYAIAVDNQKEYWNNWFETKKAELGIRDEELKLENTRMIFDAASTVIGIGADLGGTYMMTQSYNKRTLMQGAPTVTNHERYNAQKKLTGGTYVTKKRGK